MMASMNIVALAGGVGAARFLEGLVQVAEPTSVTVIGNTGDDERFHGLQVCPDLDSVTYRLAGQSNPDTGWGLAGESFRAMEALERYGADTWFRLGDLDLGTHLFRTQRLAAGATLTEVTSEIATAWGLEVTLVPMSDDACPTFIHCADGRRLAMQEWFVREQAGPDVRSIDLTAAAAAHPSARALSALDEADVILICPSNPVISIAPILAVPGLRDRLATRRERVVAVSPIVGGDAVKGPAARMLANLEIEVSAAGVAGLYRDVCGAFVMDEVDAALRPDVEALGMTVATVPTIMHDPRAAGDLARAALHTLAGSSR